MKPTPSPDPSLAFAASLALAESGRLADAIASALAAAGEPADETLAIAGAQALRRIANLAETAGDLTSADRALGLARRLRPSYADLQFHHAAVMIRRGRLPEARQALEAALRTHPGYLVARVELAILDAREGRIGEALAALRAIRPNPGIDEPHAFEQGLHSLERADWESADAHLRRAVRGADPDLERSIERYRALMSASAADRAAETIRESLERHAAYPDLHHLLGAAELALGHYDDAVSSIARALELNPDYHDARVQLAVALDALGDRVGAAEQIALVLQAEPEFGPAVELAERWALVGRSAGVSPRRNRS
jgi:tetratricopeptide (TPR) repeat protein